MAGASDGTGHRPKSRTRALLGSLIFLLVAPGTVAGLVPWWITDWRMHPAPWAWLPVRIVGACLILLGLPWLLNSFFRFAWEGRGTPAPIYPTRSLVVSGFYRYVRNPMYVGVIAVILGQAALFLDIRLLLYAAVVWLGFHLFVLLYEEPTLRKTYGAEYAEFCAHVPRWIPRQKPWR